MTGLSIYMVCGTIWSLWLEHYTTTKMGVPEWTNRARIFHVVLWPIQLTIFVVTFFRNY